MEMETSAAMPPRAPRPTIDEDALASQVLEIIGGITFEALQTLEEPGERDVWPMEEGDDSVFYSDEDTTANASCDFGASECERLVNNVTADAPRRADDPEGSIIDKDNSEAEEAVTQLVMSSEQGEERQELQRPKTEPMDQSGAGDPQTWSDPRPEESMSSHGDCLQPACTGADMQTQPEHNKPAEKVNPPVEEDSATLDVQTSNLKRFDVTNEESRTCRDGEADVPEQMSGAERHLSSDRPLQVNRDPERDQDVHVPAGFHQNPSAAYSTLPLPKKSSNPKSFNHLSSSKYSTVSYRKIRRGNTQQKIEEFEYMIMNL